MNKRVLILALGLSGCAEMNQPLTYWDKHGGSITVHHVSGKTDQTETLTTKEFKSDQVEGGFKVVSSKADFKPAKKPEKKSASERQLAERVDSLTKQIATLKDELQSSKRPPSPKKQITSTDETNATAEAPNPVSPPPQAEANADDPRASQ